MTIKGAELLKPIFEAQNGKNGRLSVQTDPRFYRDPDAIVRQAEHFAALAPNIIVKIPVTAAGIPAIEEATYRGISINATVCFSLPQCVEVAEAFERGLKRREKEGKDISTMGSVCTIMVGRARRLAEGRTPTSTTSASIPASSNGQGSPCSRRPIACSRSAATASGCSRPRSATTCTGAS